jgi:L-asparaginase II
MRPFSPLQIEVLRGESVESRHFVDAVVVDANGAIVESYGEPQTPVYARSMIKPIQAIPFVLSGAHDLAPDVTKAIAISCASHASEQMHLDVLKAWHQKLGIQPEDSLACGPQKPDDDTVFFELIRAFKSPGRINNNCSGKHTGMIATALARGLDPRGYESYTHEIQKEIRKHLTENSGIDHETAPWGIDGCGLPAYVIPQLNIAKMMSVFLAPEKHQHGQALQLIRKACALEPYMVGGHDWPCSEINAATGGRIFVKVGAEANYAALIYDQGLAIVLKARDGGFRAAEAALAELLMKHGQLKKEEREKIRAHALPPMTNWSGRVVGSVRVQPA